VSGPGVAVSFPLPTPSLSFFSFFLSRDGLSARGLASPKWPLSALIALVPSFPLPAIRFPFPVFSRAPCASPNVVAASLGTPSPQERFVFSLTSETRMLLLAPPCGGLFFLGLFFSFFFFFFFGVVGFVFVFDGMIYLGSFHFPSNFSSSIQLPLRLACKLFVSIFFYLFLVFPLGPTFFSILARPWSNHQPFFPLVEFSFSPHGGMACAGSPGSSGLWAPKGKP